MKNLLASFKATAAQALSAVDTITQVIFGAAATGAKSIFVMAADGSMTVAKNTGTIAVEALLNLGTVDSTNTGIFVATFYLNGAAVGDPQSVSVVGTGESREMRLEHTFDSLGEGDIITVQFGLDAAGSATTGGLVLTTPTSALADWGAVPPATLNVYTV